MIQAFKIISTCSSYVRFLIVRALCFILTFTLLPIYDYSKYGFSTHSQPPESDLRQL